MHFLVAKALIFGLIKHLSHASHGLVEMVPIIVTGIAANRMIIDAYRLVEKRKASVGTISTEPWMIVVGYMEG